MRYEAEGGDPANAGLQVARAFLEPVKERHPWITYADLWTLAGVVALKEMGGPDVRWLPGRTDYVDDSKLPPRGRLPDAAQGADHLRHIFYRMGFNDQEIVALAGAHNLGRAHTDRSGFEGPWVNNPTRFSKDEQEESLMMLPTDMALISDTGFLPWVKKYADDKELFFQHFADVFAKLLELGIKRDEKGEVTNSDNVLGGYISAPKKNPMPQGPLKSEEQRQRIVAKARL